jgi:hypothetical protein
MLVKKIPTLAVEVEAEEAVAVEVEEMVPITDCIQIS